MRKILASLFCACLFSTLVTGEPVSLPASTRAKLHPAISAATVAPLTITSGTPPAGKVGKVYGTFHFILGHSYTGFPLTASGGVPPYKWSATGLPPGLLISVLYSGGSTRCCIYIPMISGTPKTAGTYHPVLTVTDSATLKHHKSVTYTIKIYPR